MYALVRYKAGELSGCYVCSHYGLFVVPSGELIGSVYTNIDVVYAKSEKFIKAALEAMGVEEPLELSIEQIDERKFFQLAPENGRDRVFLHHNPPIKREVIEFERRKAIDKPVLNPCKTCGSKPAKVTTGYICRKCRYIMRSVDQWNKRNPA